MCSSDLLLKVRVVGLDIAALSGFLESVDDNDDVTPAGSAFLGENDATVRDGEDGIAEIAVLAADAI